MRAPPISLMFIALEGYSGSGKTTVARMLERRGWLRLAESANILPNDIKVGDRADKYSDYSLFGATMTHSATIASQRQKRRIVSEGYLISDLAYALIRYKLKMSDAFPKLFQIARDFLRDEKLRPDVYILLTANEQTIRSHQRRKSSRDRIITESFYESYYTGIERLHRRLGQQPIIKVQTSSNVYTTLKKIESGIKSVSNSNLSDGT